MRKCRKSTKLLALIVAAALVLGFMPPMPIYAETADVEGCRYYYSYPPPSYDAPNTGYTKEDDMFYYDTEYTEEDGMYYLEGFYYEPDILQFLPYFTGPFMVLSPQPFQKVTEILLVEVAVDTAELGDTVSSVTAVISDIIYPLTTVDEILYTASINFFELGIANMQVHEVQIILTTAGGVILEETIQVPYIFEGAVLSYFSSNPDIAAVQINDFYINPYDRGWEADISHMNLAVHELNSVPTTLVEVGFVATHPSSWWQEIKPHLNVSEHDLTGVVELSFDIYIPFFSTGGGSPNAALNAQNSTWALEGKIVIDGEHLGYNEVNFPRVQLNNTTHYTRITGPEIVIRPNSSPNAGTTWLRRSVSLDVSAINMTYAEEIVLGLVLVMGSNRPTFSMPLFMGNIRFYSDPVMPRTQIFDYFESYLGNNGWFNHLNPATNATAKISGEYARFGDYGIRLSADGSGPGAVTLNSRSSFNNSSLDWSHETDFTNFFFWVRPHDAGEILEINITSGGTEYSTVVNLNSVIENAWRVNDWYRVNVPFTEFVSAGGSLGTAANRESVSCITFTIQSGSIYLDHIYAHRNVPNPVNYKTPLDISSFVDKGGEPVDPNITVEAASLFQFLRNVMYNPNVVMFGHQQTTQDGLSFSGHGDFTRSDVKLGVNDYPAVFGYDSMTFAWDLEEATESAIFAAHELGAIITLASHIPNPMGVGLPYNNMTPAFGPDGVLVEGTAAHTRLVEHFEMIYEFSSALQDAGVPIIFRPWHEVTRVGGSNFFWWHTASPQQYVELWQWSYYFLVDRGINNLLWAYSPNTDNAANIIALYTPGPYSFFPGDEYVDIFGYDTYTTNFAGPGNNFVSVLNALFIEATERGKILALTETGSNTQGNPPPQNYFVNMLDAILAGEGSRYTAYVLTWANYGPTNFFIPWPEFDNEPEHPRHECFVRFYNDPGSVFASQLGGFKAITGLRLRAVSGVSIVEKDMTLNVGETEELTAIVRPVDAANTNVTWVSSDTNVITVSAEGAVRAVGPGIAVITVTTEDGEFYAYITITVSSVNESTLHRITFMRNGGTLNGVARDIAVHNVPSGAAFYSVPVEIPVAAREGFRLAHWRVDFAGENRTHLFLTSAELANFEIAHGHLHALPANSNLIIRAIWELAPVEPPECEDCNAYPCECPELCDDCEAYPCECPEFCEYCNAYTCAPFSIRLYQRPNGAEMHRLRFNNPNPVHNNLIPAAQFSVTATLPDYTCAINLLTIVGGANNTIQRIDIPFGNWQTITVTVSRGCASDTVVLVNPLYTSN